MSTARPVVLGLSCGIVPPDPTRALFKGKALHYGEASLSAALARAGAVPLLLPALGDPAVLAAMLEHVDGLVLSGGTDVSPATYGETAIEPAWAGDPERDAYERALITAALARRRPILGVCRGAQILNAALGGDLHQDIAFQVPGALCHRDWDRYDDNGHHVDIAPGSWLAGIHGAGQFAVNSVHHQAIRRVAPGLRCVALAPDAIAEAVERVDDEHFMVGIQWHPEWQRADDPTAPSPGDALFAAFVAVVRDRRP